MSEIPQIPATFSDYIALIDHYESASDETVSYIVELKKESTASERGKILLDLEDCLCNINPRIRVWHVPLGDKNSLRNLRGISIN